MVPAKARIDVFISSTSIDLPEHRAAVISAIQALKLTPVGMEIWPKSGDNPVEKCRKTVFDSEIFIGIYAHRYGWRPDGPGTPSITEMEYDWAGEVRRENKPIPRLCFIMARDFPWPEARMELDAKADLDRFKARVSADEVGFFTTPENLALQVTQALVATVKQAAYRATEPYLRWLHEESKRSGLLRVLNPRDATNDSRSITVDNVYTPLNTRRMVLRDADGRPVDIDLRQMMAAEAQAGGQAREQGETSAMTAMETANHFPRLVLLGDPGSGKSTFLQFLTLSLSGHLLDRETGWMQQLVTQGWEQGERLPIVVTLRDFAQDIPAGTTVGTARLLFDHIERQLSRHRLEACYPALCEALENGSTVVLLDGLDEVPDARRELIRQTVTDFIQRNHPDTRYIVTCRILSYAHAAWKLPGFNEETIALFERDQIDHFIQAWYTALAALNEMDTDTAQRRAQELMAEMDNEAISRIAQNPMLLTVMAIVHNHQGALPKEIARLYQDCVDLLMLKWRPSAATSLMSALAVRDVDLDQMLEQIAYEAHDSQAERQGAADIPEHDIVRIARIRLGGDLSKAAIFCDYVEKQAGLLVGRGQVTDGWRVFSFPHRTFQEFLAGRYAANNDFPDLAPALAERGANWREVLLLATGHLVFNQGQTGLALSAIDSLCLADDTPQSESDWHKVWLAGDMLNLIGLERIVPNRKGPGLIKRISARLSDLLYAGHLAPVERAAAGRTLARLGDPRVGVGLRADGLPDIDWVTIPAGEFIYQDQQKLSLPAFEISRYPITYMQYQAFIDDPQGFYDARWWEGLALPEGHNSAPDEQRFKYGNHPRENVSWYDAVAFCRWLSWRLGGGYALEEISTWAVRLPTEVEWEKAARGMEGLIYPYGNEFDASKGNTYETGIGQTSAVGLFHDSRSPYGIEDMSGNVFEWCLTDYNSPAPKAEEENARSSARRVVRGGSWGFNRDLARAAFRFDDPPFSRYDFIGFRVVWLPPSQGH